MIGRRIGVFEVVAKIGEGGMGEVYRATDTRLKRAVALKVLPDAFAGDPDRMARVQREAEVLASLNHPHIAHLYGIERHEGSAAPFLVMELVEGEDLAARVSRGPIPLADALPIAGQVAEALEAAHEKGVIHRDLKPGNIMVTPDGVVKVLDFGLAKALDPADLARSANLSASPTLTAASLPGVILGTAAYMAPEQAKGKVVDKRADIWAFGCVLFEMLTGRRAFAGEDVSETLAFVLTKEPAWKFLPPDTPSEVVRLLRRCLEKDSKRRLRDIGEARIALDNTAVPELAVPSVAVGKERNLQRVLWPLATAILIATLSIVSFVHFREIAPEARAVVSNLMAPDDRTYDFEALGPPALSPDGRSIVFVARSNRGVSQLWLRRLDSAIARPLAGTDRGGYPFWSPDGRFVAFGASGQLKKVDVSGGPAVPITTLSSTFRGGTWNSSDDIVFGVTGNGRPLFRVSAAGGAPVPATPTESHGKPADRRLPWFLPDGRHFLYSSTWGTDESCICVGVLDHPDGAEPQVAAAASQGIYADGHLLYVREDTLMAQRFDVAHLVTTGEPEPVQAGIATQGFPRAGIFSVAAGGWLVYQPVSDSGLGGQQQLTWLDRTGRSIRTLGEPARFGDISLSPDRTRLGATRTEGSGSSDVWIYDVARGVPTKFTTHGAADRETVWSPDGRTIFWRSGRQGPGDLFRKDSNFSGADELVYANAQNKRATSISPDGGFLLFNDTPTDNADLWLLPLTPGSKGVPLEPSPFLQTPAGEGLGQFSPDGAWVAYQSNESGVQEIYATPFPGPGGKVRISLDGGTQPRWRRDGKEIFYASLAGQLTATEVTIARGTLVPGRTETLFANVAVNRGYLWDVSADGQQFIVALGDAMKPLSLTLVQNWTRTLK